MSSRVGIPINVFNCTFKQLMRKAKWEDGEMT